MKLSSWGTNARRRSWGLRITGIPTQFHVSTALVANKRPSYFNLSGKTTIEGTEATLSTTQYLPLDSTGIPTGHITSYPGITPNQPFTLGLTDPDIDDCFIVNPDPSSVPLDTRPLPLHLLGSFSHPLTSVHLQVFSTEPAFQFYTGKYIDVPATESSPARPPRSGFCVEPSRYVNAPNVGEWRGMCLVKRGEVWGSRTVYKAWGGLKV
jgi:aldose 1-epimerase